MKKPLVVLLLSTALINAFTSFSVQASDDDTYTFIGFGLSHYDDLANLSLSKVDIDLVPEVALGFGKNYQLNQDWQLATEISLHYAKAHFSGLDTNNAHHQLSQRQQAFSGNNSQGDDALGSRVSGNLVSGHYEALGLWATSRFKYVGFSQKITPFIELAVGAVETNHATLFGEEKNHGISYKAVTGLEFEIANDVSFSLGFGVSDNDNNL